MLSFWEAYSSCHRQALVHSFNSFIRQPMLTMVTVIIIALALSLPTLFWVFTNNMSHMTKIWHKQGHISLYLQLQVNDQEIADLLQQIKGMKEIDKVSLKTAQQGLTELASQEGMQDVMKYLPQNPLPAVIEITPAVSVDSPAKLDLLARRLNSLNFVAHAKMDMEWISRLHVVLNVCDKITQALMLLLALAVLLIIGNTLRSAIHHQHEEIQVLKLIGASDAYILRPFLYAGVWYGIAGAVVAILLVNCFILSLGLAVNRLITVYQMHYPLMGLSIRQILLLISLSSIIGWLGARLSVRRHLALIEP